MGLTYRAAGVDIDRGDELVERIKPLARSTRIPEVVDDVGGFAGLCALPLGIEDPILVSGTDGVGTKLKLAFELRVHDTIGIDLVAMCVNDVVTTGARPLFFLDYFATGGLELAQAESVIAGIARGCKESGCALLGGETAEMPGMYQPGEYDLAGFAVGVVARKKLVNGARVAAGDAVIGLASSGLHSNGYSLARTIVAAKGASFTDRPEPLGGATLGEAMLRPTVLYAGVVRAWLDAGLDLRAMSHITGGGLPGNLPRVLPEGLGARVAVPSRAPLFDLLQSWGDVEETEMRRVFNGGVGFVVVVPQAEETRAIEIAAASGHRAFALGRIVPVDVDRPFEERVEYT
jgi:phosphoribosylformylglycinamidine cyclo-ligase